MPKSASKKSSKGSECVICGTHISRSYDMSRHLKRHVRDKNAISFHCEYVDCKYATLQKSNLQTHYRTHTGLKDKCCPDCSYATGDPSSLIHHRVRKHGYVTKSKKAAPSTLAVVREQTGPQSVLPQSSSGSPSLPARLQPLECSLVSPDIAPFCMPNNSIVPRQMIPGMGALHPLSEPTAYAFDFDGPVTQNSFPEWEQPLQFPGSDIFGPGPVPPPLLDSYSNTFPYIWDASLLSAGSLQPPFDLLTPQSQLSSMGSSPLANGLPSSLIPSPTPLFNNELDLLRSNLPATQPPSTELDPFAFFPAVLSVDQALYNILATHNL